jgi:serine/threonine protein kinase
MNARRDPILSAADTQGIETPDADASAVRDELLAELADDFARRYRLGERPSIDEYAKKHPQLATEIRDVFPAMVAMEQPGAAAGLEAMPVNERVGATIGGRYKLLERIGEGGFGVVFMAEQLHPVRRKVALKLVKPGMDTKQVIARFEAERQALALMDHEHIARVLDAGATETGRPYFVMELVHGIQITEYCDKNKLSPRERLELFLPVCRAVQHAHTKGVIHRDIKPTNVLVTLHDGVPVPKVIDFGISKAMGRQLTERTLFTNFAQMVGTPLYMSPEQAEMSGLDVDTRSDIYSLGVLLYELLTGTTPFDKDRLKSAAVDEVRRIIREEEPPRPSTRLGTLGENLLLTVSQSCRTDPRRLGQIVRGELDWIVMRAMEKDRTRRYETANALARDVERYLRDEAVEACPPSTMYRFSKFARRNKVPLLIAAGSLAALLVLTASLIVSNVLITRERNEKSLALHAKDVALQTAKASEEAARQSAERAEAQSQRAEASFLRSRIAIRDLVVKAAQGDGEWSQLNHPLRKKFADEAIKFYETIVQEAGSKPEIQYETAVGYRSLAALMIAADNPRAKKLIDQSIAILERLQTDFPGVAQYRQQYAWSHFILASIQNRAGHSDDAMATLQKSTELYETLVAQHPEVPDYPDDALIVYRQLGDFGVRKNQRARAEKAFRRALVMHDVQVAKFPKQPGNAPVVAYCYFQLAELLIQTGREKEATDVLWHGCEADPNDLKRWCDAAALYLWTRDEAGYQRVCRQMLDRFATDADGRPDLAVRIVRTCTLAPGAVGTDADFARVDKIAVRTVSGTGIFFRNIVMAKGLSDLRAGRFKQAADWLARTAPSPDGNAMDATIFAGIAIAQQRQGHATEAKTALASARTILTRKVKTPNWSAVWLEWMHAEVMCREAGELVASAATTSNAGGRIELSRARSRDFTQNIRRDLERPQPPDMVVDVGRDDQLVRASFRQ